MHVVIDALQGQWMGDSVMVKMQPAQVFGGYDPELVTIESLDDLPQPLAVGMLIQSALKGDSEEAILYRVTDMTHSNHSLAGMALVFKGHRYGHWAWPALMK